ncbi:hypothetical protein D5F01_LYC02070 [Larimichthys crocea]|uniref:Uncharacterized protein n=1 Tax=Larimichthys crocea TaxID=215358 RepID=A0A6G0J7H2_LARCR|nr:hypothetical protein D5F01_LYC02070 [Larimichthys crocea]
MGQRFAPSYANIYMTLRTRGYSKRFLRYIKNQTLAALAPTHSLTARAPAQVSLHTQEQGLVPNPNLYPNQGLYPTPNPNLDPNPLPNPNPSPHPHPNPSPHPNPNLSPHPNPNPYLSPSPNPNLSPYPSPNLSPNPNLPPNPNPNPKPSIPYPNQGLHPNTTITHIIPFISTFSHKTTGLHHIIKQNFSHLQVQHPAFHNSKTISAYRRNKNLQDILVHSKYTDHRPPVGPLAPRSQCSLPGMIGSLPLPGFRTRILRDGEQEQILLAKPLPGYNSQ